MKVGGNGSSSFGNQESIVEIRDKLVQHIDASSDGWWAKSGRYNTDERGQAINDDIKLS